MNEMKMKWSVLACLAGVLALLGMCAVTVSTLLDACLLCVADKLVCRTYTGCVLANIAVLPGGFSYVGWLACCVYLLRGAAGEF